MACEADDVDMEADDDSGSESGSDSSYTYTGPELEVEQAAVAADASVAEAGTPGTVVSASGSRSPSPYTLPEHSVPTVKRLAENHPDAAWHMVTDRLSVVVLRPAKCSNCSKDTDVVVDPACAHVEADCAPCTAMWLRTRQHTTHGPITCRYCSTPASKSMAEVVLEEPREQHQFLLRCLNSAGITDDAVRLVATDPMVPWAPTPPPAEAPAVADPAPAPRNGEPPTMSVSTPVVAAAGGGGSGAQAPPVHAPAAVRAAAVTFHCIVCMDDVPASQAVTLQCHHQFCGNCVVQHVRAQLLNRSTVTPAGFRCLHGYACTVGRVRPADYARASELASDDTVMTQPELDRADNAVAEASVAAATASCSRSRDRMIRCPDYRCARLFELDHPPGLNGYAVSCPNCDTLMCAGCVQARDTAAGDASAPWVPHSGKCADVRQRHRTRPTHAEEEEATAAALSASLAAGETRRCPHCNAYVSRTRGCDHMTCNCDREFCFYCGSGDHWRSVCPERAALIRARRAERQAAAAAVAPRAPAAAAAAAPRAPAR